MMLRLKFFGKGAQVALLGLLPLVTLDLNGQEGAPPPPKPWDQGDKGFRGPGLGPGGPGGERGPGGDRGPGPGGPGDFGSGDGRGGRERGDMFRKLSDEERKKVRDAFDRVWERPEVEAARERLRVANDEYRKVMQEALQAVDPEVVKILDKSRPPPFPDFNDPEFGKKVVERLRQEGSYRGREEGGQGPLHDRILASPVVTELLKKLNEATPEQRRRAWEEFREAYFRAMRELSRPPGEEGREHGRDRRDHDRDRERNRDRDDGPKGEPEKKAP